MTKIRSMKTGGIISIVAVIVLCAGMTQAQLTRQDIVGNWDANSVAMNDVNTTNDDTGYGAVSYGYRIGKHTLTYEEFQASGIASDRYGTGSGEIGELGGANYPAINYTYYEAAALCNWLTSGNTNNGAYSTAASDNWGAANASDYTGLDRDAAVAEYGQVFVLPTEDEWYKAAYYDAEGDQYFDFANGSNTPPVEATSTTSGGWNYNSSIGAPWEVASGTEEQNGTYDMVGNIWELNEGLHDYGGTPDSGLTIRGGTFSHDANYVGADFRTGTLPDSWKGDQGVRIVSIPEPGTGLLLAVATMGIAILRRKWRR